MRLARRNFVRLFLVSLFQYCLPFGFRCVSSPRDKTNDETNERAFFSVWPTNQLLLSESSLSVCERRDLDLDSDFSLLTDLEKVPDRLLPAHAPPHRQRHKARHDTILIAHTGGEEEAHASTTPRIIHAHIPFLSTDCFNPTHESSGGQQQQQLLQASQILSARLINGQRSVGWRIYLGT